ncbi:MAG: calcium-binding protein [Chlorogloea purpurea SAG 13.99]|nr:calcium-binding protein [Chlorogloea purpurea SAG 13.99]
MENLTLTGTAVNGTGNALNNTIIGNGSNNSLNGGAGNDILNGGAGTDTLIGGAGNDSYQVDTITDTITENAGEGTDTIQSSLDFNLNGYAQIENLTLTGTAIINGTGNALNNTINGNGSNNSLNGGAGNDNLNGGAGDDTLIGGLGNDNLTGSTGADRFVFNTPSEARDTLRDFSAAAGDLIQILAAGFGGGLVTGTLTGDRLLSGAGISAAGNALQRFIFNTTNGALFFDADGNGAGFAATQIATLTGVTALGNTNIVVI